LLKNSRPLRKKRPGEADETERGQLQPRSIESYPKLGLSIRDQERKKRANRAEEKIERPRVASLGGKEGEFKGDDRKRDPYQLGGNKKAVSEISRYLNFETIKHSGL